MEKQSPDDYDYDYYDDDYEDDDDDLYLQAAVHQYEMLSRQQGSTSQVKVRRHFISFINFISKFDIIYQFHLKICKIRFKTKKSRQKSKFVFNFSNKAILIL